MRGYKSKASFEILRMSIFQNWPYLPFKFGKDLRELLPKYRLGTFLSDKVYYALYKSDSRIANVCSSVLSVILSVSDKNPSASQNHNYQPSTNKQINHQSHGPSYPSCLSAIMPTNNHAYLPCVIIVMIQQTEQNQKMLLHLQIVKLRSWSI